MNKKDITSIYGKRKYSILATVFPPGILLMMTMIIVRTTKPNMFETVHAQDLKPPTTGKTSPNVKTRKAIQNTDYFLLSFNYGCVKWIICKECKK